MSIILNMSSVRAPHDVTRGSSPGSVSSAVSQPVSAPAPGVGSGAGAVLVVGSRPVWLTRLILIALVVAVVVSAVFSVAIGSVTIPPSTVGSVIGDRTGVIPVAEPGWTASQENIVWVLRLPRVLAGIAIGAALSVAGAAIQGLVRNPLADPYLLGISSGASAGAAGYILFGFGAGVGATALAGSAFIGAVVAISLVFLVSRAGGRLIPARLIFAGIAVGFALTALTNLMVFLSSSRDGARAVLFWTLGSLNQSRWDSLALLWVITIGCIVVLWVWSRRFDAISLGDDTARTLGTHPTRFRTISVAVVAIMVAVSVSVSGAIGFVGLVIPHICRMLVGSSHRILIPTCALFGALVLIWADTLARSIVAPAELPLGILTALLGTPLLIILIHRMNTR